MTSLGVSLFFIWPKYTHNFTCKGINIMQQIVKTVHFSALILESEPARKKLIPFEELSFVTFCNSTDLSGVAISFLPLF